MQRRPGIGLYQQLCAESSGAALHGRRYRAQQFDARQVLFGHKALGGGTGFVEETFGLPRLVCFGTQQGQVRVGRQPGGSAFVQGLFGEGEVALLG